MAHPDDASRIADLLAKLGDDGAQELFCLASMGIDADYDDTLMHVSGSIFKDDVRAQVKPFMSVRYIDPAQASGHL